MKTSIKYNNVLIAGIVLVCLFGCQKKNNKEFQLQTFETKGGWGYNIVLNEKVIVSQPIIPAIDTVMPFPNKKSAEKIGQIVLEKIKNKENFSVSKQEIEYSLSY